MSTQTQTLEETGDFVLLAQNEEYGKYFAMLERASKVCREWYQQVVDGAVNEEKIVTGFLDKLIFTIKLLAFNHLYSSQKTLRLDLNDSGYPHCLAIMSIGTDLTHRTQDMSSLNTQANIKQAMLTWLLERKEDCPQLLEAMGHRRYVDELDGSNVILPFTPGELVWRSETESRRQYLFSWLCYDPASNVPHVYILLFEQDKSEYALDEEDGQKMFERFVEVVRREGDRVPPLHLVAIGIDDAFKSIHPKILKRIKLGPIFSPMFSKESNPIIELIKQHGSPEDFGVHLRSEFVFSARQVAKKGNWLTGEEIREIFAVPQDDIECAIAGASSIHRSIILPHHIVSCLTQQEEALKPYQTIITYTRQGKVYG